MNIMTIITLIMGVIMNIMAIITRYNVTNKAL
jgi:hypothetical protein